MIRQPEVKSAAAMLRAALAEEGVTLSHQKSLNLAARMRGFKNWAHAQTEPSDTVPATEAPAAAPSSREEDLAETLEWVCNNYLSTLGGRPVRDADECLSRARVLLGKPLSSDRHQPSPAPFNPQRVDWNTVLEHEDFTHLLVNGNERELCHVHKLAFQDLGEWRDWEATEAVLNRLVFAYTIAEASGTMRELRIRDLLHAFETEPGVITLNDGRTLQLLEDAQFNKLVFSPAANDLL